MSCVDYFECKNCGFTYETVNYYFCFREDTGVIEKYQSLFSTIGYSAGSIVKGRVIEHYCKNCDKVVSIYQTGRGSSLFTREATIEFLKKYIPEKREKLLKTAVILENFSQSVQADESLVELRNYLELHDHDLYYKINLDDFISQNAFESMDFNMDNYIDGDDYDLKSLYVDLSSHMNKADASALDKKELFNEISRRYDFLSNDLRNMEKEIPMINYFCDEFNVSMEGEEIEDGICPVCRQEFYEISPYNPCPKCGKKEISHHRVLYD